jgi:hypothetical protein
LTQIQSIFYIEIYKKNMRRLTIVALANSSLQSYTNLPTSRVPQISTPQAPKAATGLTINPRIGPSVTFLNSEALVPPTGYEIQVCGRGAKALRLEVMEARKGYGAG